MLLRLFLAASSTSNEAIKKKYSEGFKHILKRHLGDEGGSPDLYCKSRDSMKAWVLSTLGILHEMYL